MEKTIEQDRRSEKDKTTKRIIPAGLFYRCVAAVIDLAITAFVGGILLIGAQALMNSTPVVQSNRQEITKYSLDSGLFHYKDDDPAKDVVPYTESTNYKDYEAILVNYYTNYKVSGCPSEYQNAKYTIYWYNVHIIGLEENAAAEPYTDLTSRPDLVVKKGPQIFEYQKGEGDVILYDQLPVLKTSVSDVAALHYYFISETENTEGNYYVYSYAVTDLYSTNYFNSAYTEMYNWYYTFPIIVSFALSALIFYFIIPILTKNGQTLGKLSFHIGLVNKLGYQYKKVQLIPRFFFTVLLLVTGYIISLFFAYSLFVFLAIATLLLLVSYCIAVFTTEHKAIHDYFAGTIVIDLRQSTWFKDAEEEKRIQKRIDEYINIQSDEELDYEKNPNLLYVNGNFEDKEKGDSSKGSADTKKKK